MNTHDGDDESENKTESNFHENLGVNLRRSRGERNICLVGFRTTPILRAWFMWALVTTFTL